MEVLLGTKEHGDHSEVWIDHTARTRHMAVFGKSGTGKSTLLRNMIVSDIYSGHGVTVIDPHGSLIEDLLHTIPRSRTNDVIYLNPADPARVLGLNVLQSVRSDERHLVVSSVISIIRNTWPLNWGPRSEWVLEHCVYALLEQPEPVSLVALPKLLTDPAYRARVIKNVSNPAVLSFFHFYETTA